VDKEVSSVLQQGGPLSPRSPPTAMRANPGPHQGVSGIRRPIKQALRRRVGDQAACIPKGIRSMATVLFTRSLTLTGPGLVDGFGLGGTSFTAAHATVVISAPKQRHGVTDRAGEETSGLRSVPLIERLNNWLYASGGMTQPVISVEGPLMSTTFAQLDVKQGP
jgi:hypothetical protein